MQDKNTLLSRIEDAVLFVQRRSCPKYIGFLDEQETSLALTKLHSISGVLYRFWSGYPEGERSVLGVFPLDWEIDTDAFPIVPISFNYRKQDKLSHRDFLGALMALGIERDTVGDIVVGIANTIVFVHKNIADYCICQITKIGSVGVRVELCDTAIPLLSPRLEEDTTTIASVRLDNVVGAVCKVSRSKAVALIEGGLVAVNGEITEKSTKQVPDGCKLTVRGFGKFIIVSTAAKTRKGRIVLEYKRYI